MREGYKEVMRVTYEPQIQRVYSDILTRSQRFFCVCVCCSPEINYCYTVAFVTYLFYCHHSKMHWTFQINSSFGNFTASFRYSLEETSRLGKLKNSYMK